MADKLSGDRLILASSTQGSLDPAPACHVCLPSTQPVVRPARWPPPADISPQVAGKSFGRVARTDARWRRTGWHAPAPPLIPNASISLPMPQVLHRFRVATAPGPID